MIQQNSPALLSMMNSVRPGTGNMNTAPAYMPVPFQSPYPSPWEIKHLILKRLRLLEQ